MAKIIVAEDERDIRDLIAFTLRYAGFEVVTVENGEDAVSSTRLEMPDLVILDVRMPRMTGYDACLKIKSDPLTKDIPVVFLSAKGQEAEIRTGLQSGAEEYLIKPFAPLDLVEKVKSILQKSGK